MAGSTHQQQVRGSHMQIGQREVDTAEKNSGCLRLVTSSFHGVPFKKVRAFHTESLDQPAADETAAVRRQFGCSLRSSRTAEPTDIIIRLATSSMLRTWTRTIISNHINNTDTGC